jgi:hypothetical protein
MKIRLHELFTLSFIMGPNCVKRAARPNFPSLHSWTRTATSQNCLASNSGSRCGSESTRRGLGIMRRLGGHRLVDMVSRRYFSDMRICTPFPLRPFCHGLDFVAPPARKAVNTYMRSYTYIRLISAYRLSSPKLKLLSLDRCTPG